MSDYMPATEDVRDDLVAFWTGAAESMLIDPAPTEEEARAEFERWHAEEIRRAKAEAWDECVDEAEGRGGIHDYAASEMYKRNPYREAADNA